MLHKVIYFYYVTWSVNVCLKSIIRHLNMVPNSLLWWRINIWYSCILFTFFSILKMLIHYWFCTLYVISLFDVYHNQFKNICGKRKLVFNFYSGNFYCMYISLLMIFFSRGCNDPGSSTLKTLASLFQACRAIALNVSYIFFTFILYS